MSKGMPHTRMLLRHEQRGATLIVALIMLVVMTLLALGAIRVSTTNLQIISNMQSREEAMSAAQAGLNQLLSSGGYFTDPTTAPTSLNVDINGDGNTDYAVTLAQPCVLSAVPILVSQLDLSNADDLKCLASSVSQNTGIMGQAMLSTASDCSKVTYRATATVRDTIWGSKSNVELVQGAWIKMDSVLANAYKADATKRCS